VNPRGRIDEDHDSAFSALLEEFLDAHQVLAGSRVLCEFGHSLAAVEFLDSSDDCFALGLCLGKSNSISKVAIGNINCGFHDSIITFIIFSVNVNENTVAVGTLVARGLLKNHLDLLFPFAIHTRERISAHNESLIIK
jgi:hypothetical protein